MTAFIPATYGEVLENVENFNSMCSIITNEVRCALDNKSKMAMAKNIQQEVETFHQ
jgi:hypothetical protein